MKRFTHWRHRLILVALGILAIAGGWMLWHSGAIGGAVFVSALVSSLTVSIGFALQGYLSGIFAGIALRAEGNLPIGAAVTVAGFTGTVLQPPELRITKLQGQDGATVPVPNQTLFSSPFTVKIPKENV